MQLRNGIRSLIVGLLFLFPNLSFGADITYDAVHHEIVIDGELVQDEVIDDYADFTKMLTLHPDAQGVRLTSPGGQAMVGVYIGRDIKRNGKLYTYAYKTCDSTCAYIWMAGKPLYYEKNSEILQHLPNVGGLVSTFSFNIVAGYVGYLGMPLELAERIEIAANYYQNNEFDFVNFLKLNTDLKIIELNRNR